MQPCRYTNLVKVWFLIVTYSKSPTEATDVSSAAFTKLDVVHLVETVQICEALTPLGITLCLTLMVSIVLIGRAVQLEVKKYLVSIILNN